MKTRSKITTDLKNDAVKLLKELVVCPSITPDDAGAMAIVEKKLEQAGFNLERIDKDGVKNLLATHGTKNPSLLLCGHLDIVPPGDIDKWSYDPFEAKEEGGKLFGRGSTDMKGGDAALITAAIDFVAKNPDHEGKLALLFTTDEEGPAIHGVKHVVETFEKRDEKYDHAIVGEPSSNKKFGDTLRVGRRGSLSGKITVTGVQGHDAYPERCANPIPALAKIVVAITELSFQKTDDGTEPTAVQVVNLDAGAGASNIIPGSASATICFRFSPLDDPAKLKKQVEAVFSEHSTSCTCDWGAASKPYYTGAKSHIGQIVSEVANEINGFKPTPSVGGGTSDGRFLRDICNEVIEFGTVGRTMHMIDEHIVLDDLRTLVCIYASVIDRIFRTS